MSLHDAFCGSLYLQKECPSKEILQLKQAPKTATLERLRFLHCARNLYLIISQKQSHHDETLYEKTPQSLLLNYKQDPLALSIGSQKLLYGEVQISFL